MFHLFKKLKLYTKLDQERGHKTPTSIQIKIYLLSFVDYQHLRKHFYYWNITLNYCSIYKINIRSNFPWKYPWSRNILKIQGSIQYWQEMALFLRKRAPKILPRSRPTPIQSKFYLPSRRLPPPNSHSITFLSVLHRNKEIKPLIIFAKGGSFRQSNARQVQNVPCWQHQIPIFQQHYLTHFEKKSMTQKVVYYQCSANYHVLQSFEVFFLWQNKFFSIYLPGATRSQSEKKKNFFRNYDPQNNRLLGFFTRKMVACGWNVPYLEVNGIYK